MKKRAGLALVVVSVLLMFGIARGAEALQSAVPGVPDLLDAILTARK